jgi:peptidoglycan/xylan/chitin deacetylase (PgdA/CDA1 family)
MRLRAKVDEEGRVRGAGPCTGISLQDVTGHGERCEGCLCIGRLGRRRFLALMASGLAVALAGCAPAVRPSRRDVTRRSAPVPVAEPAPAVAEPDAGPPLELGEMPPPHPGASQVISSGPSADRQVALTIDDGYCGDCIAQYVEFARTSGIHITFNPNGIYNHLWTPGIVADVRQMVADKQVQIGNHTWSHANLLPLSNRAVTTEIARNEDWIGQTFGITARPWFRPPFGYYDRRIEDPAAEIGYTRILMWNGTFGDATPESPQELMRLAEQYLQPGKIVLGHINHPAILSLFGQIQSIIASRNLDPVTLDEMFGTSRAVG